LVFILADDNYGPSTSKTTPKTTSKTVCVFCNGEHGPLLPNELTTVLTPKGFETILSAGRERNDATAHKILEHKKTKLCEFPYKFHGTCRSTYISKKRIASKRRGAENDDDIPTPPKRALRTESAQFDWNVHCFLCGEV
jgi:hypothetical protein